MKSLACGKWNEEKKKDWIKDLEDESPQFFSLQIENMSEMFWEVLLPYFLCAGFLFRRNSPEGCKGEFKTVMFSLVLCPPFAGVCLCSKTEFSCSKTEFSWKEMGCVRNCNAHTRQSSHQQPHTTSSHSHAPNRIYTNSHTSNKVYTNSHMSNKLYANNHTPNKLYTNNHTPNKVYTNNHTPNIVYTNSHMSNRIYTNKCQTKFTRAATCQTNLTRTNTKQNLHEQPHVKKKNIHEQPHKSESIPQ